MCSAPTDGFSGRLIMSGADQCVNTDRLLTRSLDLGEEGLAMQATRTCSVDGCERTHIARGLCTVHYDAAKHAGTLARHSLTRTGPNRDCAVDGCPKTAHGRYCPMHRSRMEKTGSTEPPPSRSTPERDETRFWSKVEKRGERECWPWRGTVIDSGYGQFRAAGRRCMAHRYAYELLVGPIPTGYEIDHVRARGCTRTDCVNPAHLEAVTPRENKLRSDNVSGVNARKAECPKGHPYSRSTDGKRFCPTCKLAWDREYRQAGRRRRG